MNENFIQLDSKTCPHSKRFRTATVRAKILDTDQLTHIGLDMSEWRCKDLSKLKYLKATLFPTLATDISTNSSPAYKTRHNNTHSLANCVQMKMESFKQKTSEKAVHEDTPQVTRLATKNCSSIQHSDKNTASDVTAFQFSTFSSSSNDVFNKSDSSPGWLSFIEFDNSNDFKLKSKQTCKGMKHILERCDFCGNSFGTAGLKIHLRRCSQKAQLPEHNNGTIVCDDTLHHQIQTSKSTISGPPKERENQLDSQASAMKSYITPRVTFKPTICYICNRQFGSHSIAIHQPQCLRKWQMNNEQSTKK